MDASDVGAIFCARCARPLQEGRCELYVVRIEAIADPTPPRFTQEDLDADLTGQLEALLRRLAERSARELEEQVARRLVLHFCVPCYQAWIEAPAGP